MLGWLMERVVERAIPPDVEDPAQERIAEEAAENAIRHVVRIAGIAGLVVVMAIALLLYVVLPSWQVGPRASLPSQVASRVAMEDATLVRAKEESEGKLQQVVMERDALQGRVAELERRQGELTTPQTQAAGRTPVSREPPEREELQTKVSDLERQVADLTQNLEALRGAAVAGRSAHAPKSSKPSGTPVSAEPRLAYRCGDGRSVPNPADCRPAGAQAPRG